VTRHLALLGAAWVLWLAAMLYLAHGATTLPDNQTILIHADYQRCVTVRQGPIVSEGAHLPWGRRPDRA
jgi:hypothetical protein